MDSEQRRKRKRLTRPTISLSTVRSLLIFSAVVSFLYLSPASFRPILLFPKIPLRPVHPIRLFSGSIRTKVEIANRVLFPDHVLLIVPNRGLLGSEFTCVYIREKENGIGFEKLRRKILSFDEYNYFESIIRCPMPPTGYLEFVDLEIKSRSRKNFEIKPQSSLDLKGLGYVNRTVMHSWEMLAYTASIDRNSVVVFVKGLNLRPDRESDPNQFSCHFGLKSSETNKKHLITTKAITAAQEVVRCRLPRSLKTNPNQAHGARVTISHGRDRTLVPSVAKVFSTKKEIIMENKLELCVCTMVWNQASALREWVTYHSFLGVEKWFIYDNNSDDEIKAVVQELNLEKYNINRHVWPWIKTQEAGFSHCALRARNECNWVAFMDVDEYFHFPVSNLQNKGSTSRNSLKTLVSNFSSTSIAEIRTSCHSFGPSGLSLPPKQGVMVGYTCRLQNPERHKSIVRPEALDLSLLNVVHHFHTRKGFKYINLPQSIGVINHYKYQVWDTFRAKFYRRVATYVADWRENSNEGSRDRAPGLGTEPIEPLDWRLRFCEVWDMGLRDFVIAHLADPFTGNLPWERHTL